jgi:hypothetical protein
MTGVARLLFFIDRLRKWLARVLTTGLLFLVYWLVLGPTAVYHRLLGRSSLEEVSLSAGKGWISREPAAHDLDRLKRLF